MKSSYTKRALAFWLAVAMVATSAPMAFARERDSVPSASTTQNGDQAMSLSATQISVAYGEEISDAKLKAAVIGAPGSASIAYSVKQGSTEVLSYSDGKVTPLKAGSGTITATVTASGYTTTTVDIPVNVEKKKISVSAATVEDKVYDKKTDATVTQVTFDGVSLSKDADYTVSAQFEDANVGIDKAVTGTVSLTGDAANKYELTSATLPTGTKANITAASVTLEVPKQTVKQGTTLNTLAKNLSDNVKAKGVDGEAVAGTFSGLEVSKRDEFRVTGQNFESDKGVYTLTGTFTPSNSNYIAKSDVEIVCDVTGLDKQEAAFETTDSQVYEKDKTVENPVTVTKGNTSAVISYDSSDKSVATIDNQGKITILKAGKTAISAAIPGNADYEAANISYELVVNPKPMTEATITSIAEQVYTGKELTPDLTVTDGSISLVKGTDYDVAYTNNVFPGTATATVTFKGNYTGTAKKTFEIQKATYNKPTGISQSVVAGQNAVLTIPVDLANAEITNYSSITVDGTDASIVDGTPTRDKNVITAKIKSGATNGQTANVKIMLTTKGYGDVTLTYTLTVADSKQQLTSSQINFASKTVTADGKTYFKLDNASLNGVTDTNGKWTYAVKGVSTLSEQSEMPSFKDAGVYTIVASYQGDKYVGSKEATLTIKPAVKSTITVSASQLGSSYDDNHKYWDLDKRGSGDGYLNLRADADDYLVNQRINGRSSEWIGMTISPEVSGTAKASGLWVSTNQSTWYELKKNDTLSLSDFYIRDIGDKTFDLWYDTDDRDCHDSLYLATDSKGSNKFEIYVDFNSYSGSSSSSSGSSSSDTSKVNGDRVSTTTVDKTPSVKNGSATVTFSSSALSDALDANKKEAKREDADKTYIELDVKTSKSVDDTTITVPRSSLDKIADEDTGLKLTTNQGTVTFDYRALAEIYDACDKTNIEFYLEEDDDDQYVLLIKDGSSDVIDLGRGSVEVTFDYKLKSGEKSSDVKVYRIGNGDKTWLSTYGGSTVYGAADVYAAAPTYVTDMKADYSSSKKKVTFTTDALGTFLITTDTLKTGSGSTTTTPTYNAFVDVPSSRWSATYINKLASLGIINGTGGGYFEPTLYVTREEFVKMLAGVAGANVTGYTSSRFPDVSLSRWSAPYIAWAADRGITTGTDGGNFAPTMRITREEMATMIYRYVQSSGKTLPAKNAPVIFADANLISGWAQTPVSVMQQAGIIDGNVTNGRYTFDPKVSASREECAKMLAVLYDLVR
ncbi:hypothetical protein B5F17_08335 [Butyricicoccus pullicaecorum]|uniref:SLH domain-containing protein n=1 Tax=Butyricicoccus pullicaecorum TaxID=501571 RepID=A0A1Y4LF27_9FIRM|nr:hypothetical protein B5F17_08335 [Butyricicoccus pullicaecorum]